MWMFCRQPRLAAIIGCLLVLWGLPAITQETGRPVRRAELVEGRKAEEKRLDDKRRTEETRPEDKRVTKIDDLARKIDITKRQNPEFLSADKLTDLLKREENSRKVQQAEHAWAGHEQEFKKIGVMDSVELQKHIDDVRKKHDFTEMLSGDRRAYGKIDSGKEGTIVIDNPHAENGGTAFRNDNVESRMKRLREAE